MMACPNHSRAQVVGYCVVCGELGCEQCVKEHQGEWYCARHYQPIQDKLERQKEIEESKRRVERQRLVVRTREGRTHYGTCLSLNPLSAGFNLETVDRKGISQGKSAYFSFSDLKAVFYVKSFDGKGIKEDASAAAHHATGAPIIVEFADGEIMQGYTMQRVHAGLPRFSFIPRDSNSNNISVLVETAAITGVYTPEEYKDKHRHEIESYLESHKNPGATKEELLGDYHFERHDYSRAIKHYRQVLKELPDSPKIRRKIISSEYNIGMRHIKSHQYEQALKCMEWVLNADPNHEQARHKAKKLKAHLARGSAAIMSDHGE